MGLVEERSWRGPAGWEIAWVGRDGRSMCALALASEPLEACISLREASLAAVLADGSLSPPAARACAGAREVLTGVRSVVVPLATAADIDVVAELARAKHRLPAPPPESSTTQMTWLDRLRQRIDRWRFRRTLRAVGRALERQDAEARRDDDKPPAPP
jgi:hypothetical protein